MDELLVTHKKFIESQTELLKALSRALDIAEQTQRNLIGIQESSLEIKQFFLDFKDYAAKKKGDRDYIKLS